MVCKELVEAVTAYLEGDLSAEDRARFDEHLAGCAGCRDYLAQIRETIRITGSLDAAALPEEQRLALQAVFRTWVTGA